MMIIDTVSFNTPYAEKKIDNGIRGITVYTGDAFALMHITAQIAQEARRSANPARVVDPPNRLVASNPIMFSKDNIMIYHRPKPI